MPNKFPFPNGDDSGWPTGDFTDLLVALDGNFMETTIDDDVVVLDLESIDIKDLDTVSEVRVITSARDLAAGGDNTISIDIDVGGGPLGFTLGNDLTDTFLNSVHLNVLWNIDFTAQQLDDMQVIMQANQQGMPNSATWQVDALVAVIVYTIFGSPILHMAQYQPT